MGKIFSENKKKKNFFFTLCQKFFRTFPTQCYPFLAFLHPFSYKNIRYIAGRRRAIYIYNINRPRILPMCINIFYNPREAGWDRFTRWWSGDWRKLKKKKKIHKKISRGRIKRNGECLAMVLLYYIFIFFLRETYAALIFFFLFKRLIVLFNKLCSDINMK